MSDTQENRSEIKMVCYSSPKVISQDQNSYVLVSLTDNFYSSARCPSVLMSWEKDGEARTVRTEKSLKYLQSCEIFQEYPLNEIIRKRRPWKGKFCLPASIASRRLRSFIPWSCFVAIFLTEYTCKYFRVQTAFFYQLRVSFIIVCFIALDFIIVILITRKNTQILIWIDFYIDCTILWFEYTYSFVTRLIS